MTGLFLSFEGGEGLGKSLQARRLADHLRERGREVILTREPGGTPLAERIRDVLLHAVDVPLLAEAQVLLFSAARAQLVRDVIRPALAAGQVVIADRFYDSTIAYQGYGQGADLAGLAAVTRFAVGDLKPHRTFLLDAPVEVTLARLGGRNPDGKKWDRFESDARNFHMRVRDGYLHLAAAEPGRFVIVRGDRAEDAIAAEIRAAVDAMLGALSGQKRGV